MTKTRSGIGIVMRTKSAKPIAGDPTTQSPFQIRKNTNYEIMSDYVPGNYWPSRSEIIAKHKGFNTFWKVVYVGGEDDYMEMTWRQVVPEKIVITKYKEV